MNTPNWRCCNCNSISPGDGKKCVNCFHDPCRHCDIFQPLPTETTPYTEATSPMKTTSPTETTSPSATISQRGTASPSVYALSSGSSPPWHGSTGATELTALFSSLYLQNSWEKEEATKRRSGRSMVEEELKGISGQEALLGAESFAADLSTALDFLFAMIVLICLTFTMAVHIHRPELACITAPPLLIVVCICCGRQQVAQLIWKAIQQRWQLFWKAIQQDWQLIWKATQQGWQLIWTATQNQPGKKASTPTQSRLEPQQQQGPSGGKRKRERAGSVDGSGRERPSEGLSKSAKQPKQQRTSLPFACPFCKRDLRRYTDCVGRKLTAVRCVKQHLKRAHWDEIDQPTKERLKPRVARGTEEEQWYNVFEILFPGSPSPATPYNDFIILEREFRPLLQELLVEEARARGVDMGDIPGAFDSAWSRAEQMLQQNGSVHRHQPELQRSFEANIQDPELSVNTQFSNDNSNEDSNDDSNDDFAVANEAPSSANTQPNPTPDMQRSQQGSTGWEEFLHDSNLFVEERSQDQQLGGPNLDGQPELSDESFEWLDYFDADGLAATEFDQPLGESSEAKA